jgi:hypothetical protein
VQWQERPALPLKGKRTEVALYAPAAIRGVTPADEISRVKSTQEQVDGG